MWKWSVTLWSLALLGYGSCQYLSRQELSPTSSDHDDPAAWDIRLAVPGEPGRDYPTLASIPKTGFSCAGKDAGYYADVDTQCQAFRVCTIGATYGFQSFLCPNGTLFNQAVFVCDWWMNVNCQGSQRYYSNNNEKFGSLRLGPSMMTDIRKMLTYPMNNPHQHSNQNNNQFVMQIYNPPFGQPFSNSGTVSENLGNPFPPTQQLQLPALPQQRERYNENQFSGSTPSPQYVPSNQAVVEQISQFQNGKLISTQNGQCVNCQPNGETRDDNVQQFGRYVTENNGNTHAQLSNGHFNVHNGHNTNVNNQNSQYSHSLNSQFINAAHLQHKKTLENSQKYQFSNTLSPADYTQNGGFLNNQHQSGKLVDFSSNSNGQSSDQQKIQNNGGGQNELEITFTKQQYTYPSQYDKQYTYKIPANQAVNGHQIGQLQEVKENLVSESHLNNNPRNPASIISSHSPPTIIAKTLTISKESKSGKLLSSDAPSSRITFKTWVVQPSKSSQFNSKQVSYKYERPKLSRQYLTPQTPRPTIPSRLYLTPSTPRPTISSRLYLAPSSSRPTQSSRLYLAPATVRPTISARLYLVPSKPNTPASTPLISKPTQSARIHSYTKPSARLTSPSSPEPLHSRKPHQYAAASTATPFYLAPLNMNPKNRSFSVTKHSHINTNHNNLTFTDILTKEKLDVTVNDIVKDTSNILRSNSANTFGQLREQAKITKNEERYPSPVYVPSLLPSIRSNKNLTSHNNALNSATGTFSRLTKDPSSSLEIPVESLKNPPINHIATLPYFKPKIPKEKSVSIKISIPEKTARYILTSNDESEFDRLEILTTGSSNYLILTNGRHSKNTRPNFIPLGKLIADKNVNISNSQAFVYDFLSDSINAAKTYENTLNENIKNFNLATTQTFGQKFQNLDTKDLNEITNKISQLTTEQYNNNKFKNANLVSTLQQTSTTSGNTYKGSSQFTNGITQQNNQQINQIHDEQIGENGEVNGNYYSSNFYSGNNGASAKLQADPNLETQHGHNYHIPNIVHSNHVNEQSSSDADITNSRQNQNLELNEFQEKQQRPGGHGNIVPLKESAEVELVQTNLPQSGSPAKLQVAPTTTVGKASAEGVEDITNDENGIGAQFHKQIIGAINHSKLDKNLVAYKADQSFYIYTKYLESKNHGISENSRGKQFGELRQIQENNDNKNVNDANKKQSSQTTTVQFIPSLSFSLDNENDQESLLKVLQNPQKPSAAYKSGEENQGFKNVGQNDPTSSIDYSVQHTVIPTKDSTLQQYRTGPTNLYAGPSSYSAPQSSVGILDLPQNGQLKAASTPSNNGYAPARLEDFEDTAGYPKATPAIPFTF